MTDPTQAGRETALGERVRQVVRGLLHPGDPGEASVGSGLAALRIVAGLMWLSNVAWKRPPDFGESTGGGLYEYVDFAVKHPVFPPYSWLVEHLIKPNFTFFGWGVLFVEALLAAFLLTGAYTRIAALVGLAQSVAIGLSVLAAPAEWPWSYYLMAAVHIVLFTTAAGRFAGVDGALLAGGDRPAKHLRVWGTLAAALGAIATVAILVQLPPLSSRTNLSSQTHEVAFGSFNLAGSLILVAVGAAMVLAARRRSPQLALAAAAVAAISALSLLIQSGLTTVWLGGDGTTGALFLTVAVAAALLGRGARIPTTPQKGL